MVRPERVVELGDSRCIELAGGSPAAVSAAAPRSRPRASRETLPSEWGVKSPQLAVRLAGGEQVHRPSVKRTLQPRDINTRKVGSAEPLMSRRRQQTAPGIGTVQDAHGVWRRACGDSWIRNRRDPSLLLTSSEGVSYKPKAKGRRAGRESEGLIVPLTPVWKGRSREGALLWSRQRKEVSVRAWPQGPTTPLKKRENSVVAFTPGPSTFGWVIGACRYHPASLTRSGRRKHHLLEVCMSRVKIIGKPYAGNPHVRFERGPQETELTGHRA
jgi:hypothetical protein